MCICARQRSHSRRGAIHLITDPVHYRHISMTVSTLSAQEGDTAVTHPSTGLFSRKTLPIALQTSDLGVFLAETLPDRRTQGLCARTFAQNVLEKRVTMPHRARFRLKRARMRGRGAETRAFPIKMRAEYGLPGNSLIARRAAGSKSNSGSGKGQQGQQRQQRKQGRQGNAGREEGARRAGGGHEGGKSFRARSRKEIFIIFA